MSEVCSNAGLGDDSCCMCAAMAPELAVGSSLFDFLVRAVAKAALDVVAVRSLRYMEVEDLVALGDEVESPARPCNSRWLPCVYV